MSEVTKTSAEWYKTPEEQAKSYAILDPDGWDRKNYDYSFNKEKITEKEYQNRLMMSTLGPKSYIVKATQKSEVK